MSLDNDGNGIQTDAEGYLVDPVDWNESVANQLAQSEQISLTPDHWSVMAFMRDYYDEHQVAPDARFTVKFLANDLGFGSRAKNRLFELFPYGYVKQACKISGMRRPRAWSTG
jgi:TusE/DsrC/DsvC family sulfur relay protein